MNILIAIRWVALAWSQVTADTISMCFQKAGILDGELDVICRDTPDDDPFLEADKFIIKCLILKRFFHLSNHPQDPLKLGLPCLSAISLASINSGLPG